MISGPMPSEAPTNSATMAPIGLIVAPILRPVKIEGSAPKNRTFQKICQRLAPSEFIRSIDSRSTAPSPAWVFRNTGKKTMMIVIRIFGSIPKPNQITRMGAITIEGTACEASIHGNRAWLSTRE